MDKARAAEHIVIHALPIVPFDGWTHATLAQAAQNAGYKRTDAIRVFSGGAIDAVNFYFIYTDTQMHERLSERDLTELKIRDRITLAIRTKLEIMAPHKEAVRRGLALQATPFHLGHGMQNLYGCVDSMWHAIGDESTDFNFYTKRMTLAAVVSATVLYWLDDHSSDYQDTWAFLDRRIENVMMIEKAKYQLRQRFTKHF